jgi:hypothetical protein
VECRTRLRGMFSEISQTAPDFDFNLGLDALTWAFATERERKLPNKDGFANPFPLVHALVDLVGADAETLYAAVLYASVQPGPGKHFNTSYLDEISDLFTNERGDLAQPYLGVRKLIINALQILACDLMALPHPITEIEDAFKKPEPKEADDLAAYYILSRGLVKDERAFAIRATEWYLRLVDIGKNPGAYTTEQRLNAYYYTDKFYAPFLEYLALQKLRYDPSYSPQAEGKGLYRLKTAMDEELIRQINPDEYAKIQDQLSEILKGFDIQKGQRQGEQKKKLFDLVRLSIEDKLRAILDDRGIPSSFVRIEARLKRPRSVFQKIIAGRTNIHDHIGIRIIIDTEGLRNHANKSPPKNKIAAQKYAKEIAGSLHSAIAKRFDQVSGRYKNFYTNPYKPDNGYRGVQNTFKFFGQDVEIQIVDLASHINNSIGSAAHFFYKLVSPKDGHKKSAFTSADMIAAFADIGSRIVVRTADELHVLRAGATVRDLAKNIHSDFAESATGATVTDHDPTNRLAGALVPPNEPLRNGQMVHIETQKARKPGVT